MRGGHVEQVLAGGRFFDADEGVERVLFALELRVWNDHFKNGHIVCHNWMNDLFVDEVIDQTEIIAMKPIDLW